MNDEALVAYEQALQLCLNDVNYALAALKGYDEALAAYDRALILDPK